MLNLSNWPAELVQGFRTLLMGGTAIPADQAAFTIVRSLPHGPVAAVVGTLRRIGLDCLLGPDSQKGRADNRCRDLVMAMIASRIIAPTPAPAPASTLAAARGLDPATATSTLGEVLATLWRRILEAREAAR